MQLFDAHSHLLDPDSLIRAANEGIAGIAVCGTNSRDWKNVLDLASTFPSLGKIDGCRLSLLPMLGIHPWFVSCRAGAETPPETAITDRGYSWKKSFQCLEKLLRENPGVGVGETGLDFSDRFANRPEQEACFAAHLDLAAKLNRPVAVHCVKAWGRLVDILKEHPAPKVILHAFGGAPELIPELIRLNCWFSFGPTVMNPKAKKVRASVVAVPEDRLLIETDSDGELLPLIEVADAVAGFRGISVESLADRAKHNFLNLFG